MVEKYGPGQSRQREEQCQECRDGPEHRVLSGEAWMIKWGQIMKDRICHAKELGNLDLIPCENKSDGDKTKGGGIS